MGSYVIWDGAKIAEFKALNESGLTAKQIAERMGLSYSCVVGARHRFGGAKKMGRPRRYMITHDGETLTGQEWCEITGVRWKTAKNRIANGMDPAEAVGLTGSKRKMDKRMSLCWYCENAQADVCPWVRHFGAVEGWEAEPDFIIYEQVKEKTLKVKKCPQFKRHERE